MPRKFLGLGTDEEGQLREYLCRKMNIKMHGTRNIRRGTRREDAEPESLVGHLLGSAAGREDFPERCLS